MAEKFDPAPTDKHADAPKERSAGDKKADELKKGLKDSFPASDPPSNTQPAKSVDAHRSSGRRSYARKHPLPEQPC
jgi:hypothetical protein